VAQAAKKHVTVILNGDGADELFGGYRRFVPFAQYNFFNAPTYLRSASRILTNVIPPSHNKKSFYNYIYRLLSFAGKQNNELFLAAGPDIFEGFENYLVPGLQSRDSNELSLILSNLNNNELSGLRQMMLSDFEVNLFSDLLVKMDIATMSHSLEGRSPMLCKEFLELIPSLPDNLKIRGGTTKYILRTLAKKLLPPEIAVQPKRGFEIPLKKWVNNDLKEIISDYLLAPNSYHTQYFNKNISNLLLSNKLRVSEEKRAKMIWSIFCLEVWYKKVYTR
jgi:asparagine synthase (glutamine-hydrolysing)